MAYDVFYVKVASTKSTKIYTFTRSMTGVLDFVGETDPSASELEKMQCVEGSLYFNPSWYTYLAENQQITTQIYLPADLQEFDAVQFGFLTHIGAILGAIQEKDGLLVAELLNRRRGAFANFTPLMLHILKPIAAEALFAWVYGGFGQDEKFMQIYNANAPINLGETDPSAILFAAARSTLKANPLQEKPNEMFVRYFAQKKDIEFTIGIVGTVHHEWATAVDAFESMIHQSVANAFVVKDLNVGEKRLNVYSSLAVSTQSESYNKHDPNALAVYIDDPMAKVAGTPGKAKAGYIRATGASILKKARPNLFNYLSTLCRIGEDPKDYENAVVIRVKFK